MAKTPNHSPASQLPEVPAVDWQSTSPDKLDAIRDAFPYEVVVQGDEVRIDYDPMKAPAPRASETAPAAPEIDRDKVSMIGRAATRIVRGRLHERTHIAAAAARQASDGVGHHQKPGEEKFPGYSHAAKSIGVKGAVQAIDEARLSAAVERKRIARLANAGAPKREKRLSQIEDRANEHAQQILQVEDGVQPDLDAKSGTLLAQQRWIGRTGEARLVSILDPATAASLRDEIVYDSSAKLSSNPKKVRAQLEAGVLTSDGSKKDSVAIHPSAIASRLGLSTEQWLQQEAYYSALDEAGPHGSAQVVAPDFLVPRGVINQLKELMKYSDEQLQEKADEPKTAEQKWSATHSVDAVLDPDNIWALRQMLTYIAITEERADRDIVIRKFENNGIGGMFAKEIAAYFGVSTEALKTQREHQGNVIPTEVMDKFKQIIGLKEEYLTSLRKQYMNREPEHAGGSKTSNLGKLQAADGGHVVQKESDVFKNATSIDYIHSVAADQSPLNRVKALLAQANSREAVDLRQSLAMDESHVLDINDVVKIARNRNEQVREYRTKLAETLELSGVNRDDIKDIYEKADLAAGEARKAAVASGGGKKLTREQSDVIYADARKRAIQEWFVENGMDPEEEPEEDIVEAIQVALGDFHTARLRDAKKNSSNKRPKGRGPRR